MLNRLLYAVGGFDGTARLRSAECYHPERDAWRAIAPMASIRSGAGERGGSWGGCPEPLLLSSGLSVLLPLRHLRMARGGRDFKDQESAAPANAGPAAPHFTAHPTRCPPALPPSPVLRDSAVLPSLCLTPSFPHSHPSHTPFHHPAVPPSIRDAAPQGSPASMIPTLVIPPHHDPDPWDPILDPAPCHPPFPSPPLPYSQSIRLHPPPPQS